MRFVMISFAVMGLAFYELSGGSDFQPRGERPTKSILAELPATSTPSRKATAPTPPTRATDLVAKRVIARRNASGPAPAQTSAAAVAQEAAEQTRQARTGLMQGLTLAVATKPAGPARDMRDTTVLSLADYVRPAAAPSASSPVRTSAPAETAVAEPEPDLREVAATRVNMRNGPGTTYSVIGRLQLGQEIEVLSDSGNGWLRVRAMPGQQVGWVAASLTGDID